MKPTRLTEDEINVVTNPDAGDFILLEIIKGMSLKEMQTFDVYHPKYMQHYKDIQLTWLNTEKHLLYERPCNEHHEVPEELLIEDFEKCHNGERFRVFYVLKYPEMVERIK
jgi:hypothetical protein